MLLHAGLGPDELAHIHAQGLRPLHQVLAHMPGQGGGAGQHPHIVGAGAHHQGPLVVFVERHHVVAAVKRPEERHFERCTVGAVHKLGAALRFLPLLAHRVIAPVHHLDSVVCVAAVGGGGLRQAAFKRVFDAGHLVPLPCVAVHVKARDGLHAFGCARRGAGRQHHHPHQRGCTHDPGPGGAAGRGADGVHGGFS